jgi:hypothetical protein
LKKIENGAQKLVKKEKVIESILQSNATVIVTIELRYR